MFGILKKLGKYLKKLLKINLINNCREVQMKKSARKTNEFNAKAFERPGLTEEEVMEIKEAFDLFDTDGGGSIDPKGKPTLI